MKTFIRNSFFVLLVAFVILVGVKSTAITVDAFQENALSINENSKVNFAAESTFKSNPDVIATPAVNSVKLEWEELYDADGYYVYQRVSGKWKKIKGTTGISYTVKNLDANTSYTFAVRAAKKLNGKYVQSAKYTTITVKTKAVVVKPKLSVEAQSTTAIKLSWTKVSDITSYVLFQRSGDSWKKLVETTSTSYTLKNLTPGKQYTFRVATYKKPEGKKIREAYSVSLVTATKPATPTLKVTSTEAKKAKVTWSDVSGETGYQIFYSTKKDSGYKMLATAKANYKTANVSGLKEGKTYYFRVRAYITVSDNTIYGGYKTVGVTVKSSIPTLTNAQALELWEEAYEVYYVWGYFGKYDYADKSRPVKFSGEGRESYPLVHPTIHSKAELRSYLLQYFDSTITENILKWIKEYQGEMYVTFPTGRGITPEFDTLAVKKQSGTYAELYLSFIDYKGTENIKVQTMNYKNGKWIFTKEFIFY